MNLPLQIYDFIAVLFPSIIFLTLVREEIPKMEIWSHNSQYGTLATILILAYIIGHLLAILSNRIEKWPYTKWILYKAPREPRSGEMRLSGRKSSVIVSKQVGNSLLSSVNEFYGLEISADSTELFNLIYSPVHDRMGKRDVFLALANMMRTLTLLSFFYTLYLTTTIAISLIKTHDALLMDFILLILSIISYWLFREGYQRNKSFSENIPYTAFLAWYKEKKINKE